MRIFSWNVNGLRSIIKKNALQDFIFEQLPDIICFGETKISEHQIEVEKIRDKFPAYEQFYSFAQRPGYSGTAIWVRKDIGAKPADLYHSGACRRGAGSAPTSSPTAAPAPCEDRRAREGATDSRESEVLHRIASTDPLDEGRITTLELPDFYLVSVYVPNSKEDLSRLAVRQEWDTNLYKFLERLQTKKPVIVCGDMNVAHRLIDLARPKENEGKHGYTVEERTGFDDLLEHAKLIDTFRHLHPDTVKYSWWSHWQSARARNIGWRIDYFLISDKLEKRLKSAEIYPEITGSDHCPISIEVA